jgi:hypothetical protein
VRIQSPENQTDSVSLVPRPLHEFERDQQTEQVRVRGLRRSVSETQFIEATRCSHLASLEVRALQKMGVEKKVAGEWRLRF